MSHGLRLLTVCSAALLAGCAAKGLVDEDRPAISLQALNRKASEITRIIDGSRSPDGKWAVGVGLEDGSVTEWGELKHGDSRISFQPMGTKEVANFLVHLPDDRIVALMDCDHMGTSASYNHQTVAFHWSPDSRWLVEEQQYKWGTRQCTVWSLGDGRRMACQSLLPHAQSALEECFSNDRTAVADWELDAYVFFAEVKGVSNQGIIACRVSAWVPKQDAPPLETEITLKASEGIVFLQRSLTPMTHDP